MSRTLYFIIIFLFFFLFSGCTGTKRINVYNGGDTPLRSWRSQASSNKKFQRSVNHQKRGFGSSPSGVKYNSSFGNSIKKERRGFGSRGITGGRSNAMANNRYSQNFFKKNFPFLFPSHPKYYRGQRSKLGLFRSK